MDYGGSSRRRTKKDLKRKRLARGYKRGGKFRTQEATEIRKDTESVKNSNGLGHSKLQSSIGKKKLKKGTRL